MTRNEIARMIDHAVLHPTATSADARRETLIAAEYQVAAICVKPGHVALAADLLTDSQTAVSTVIGFPHGGTTTATKLAESENAIASGARELDMVINVGAALAGNWSLVQSEIAALTAVCHDAGALLKVIFETDYVSRIEDKITLCRICTEEKVDYVKTSTGFGFVKDSNGQLHTQGATIENVTLMRANCPADIGIKASGGIRSLSELLRLYECGATRFGTSSTRTILDNIS